MKALRIPVQKLFLLAITSKIGASGLGWWLHDPWVLGFSVPLVIMLLYVAIGLARADSDVSDEKFADSCYYLGFIFTISSIIFSLFDLPHIAETITVIAIRFGAAMVSTVMGLIVRVYLVSFKDDAIEALHAAEDSVVDAHARLREQLLLTLEKMQEFQSAIDVAARGTVERVNIQVENLTRSYGRNLQDFFQQLTMENRHSTEQAFTELKSASGHVSVLITQYAESLDHSLARIHQQLDDHSVALSAALQHTASPYDTSPAAVADPDRHARDRRTARRERASMYTEPTTLGTALRNFRLGPPTSRKTPSNVIELPGSATARHHTPPVSMQQLHSSVTRLHDAVAQQQQATSRLMEAVERAVKRAGATDLRLASLDQHAGDSAARLLNMVQTLSEIAKDIHTIAPGFSACQSDLRAVRDAVFSEVKRNRARLGH